MLLSRLQNLEQEQASDICSQAGDDNAAYERLLNNVHNGVEVCVLCQAVQPLHGDPLWTGYYDIVFADGTHADAVSGFHLVGIENWRD